MAESRPVDRIRALRRRLGPTQEVLAGRAGVSPSWPSQVERGVRSGGLRTLLPMDVLEVLVDLGSSSWPELATRGLPLVSDDADPDEMSAVHGDALAAWDATDGPLAVVYLRKKEGNGDSERDPGRETTDVVDKKQTVMDGRRPRREWDEYHKTD